MSLRIIHHLVKFCGHRHCGSGDIMVLDCHVILKDYVTEQEMIQEFNLGVGSHVSINL